MIYHIIAFMGGFILDLILGDPYSLPHPIRWIGSLIGYLERKLNKKDISEKSAQKRGCVMVITVCAIVEACVIIVIVGSYYISAYVGCAVELVMTYYMLAAKCLKTESMKVYDALESGTIEEARYAVSMIVGRDTENLTKEQIAKAAVETVAENTSDGEIAPMIYLAIGGPVLGFLYKTINTMDSMIGYKNDKFINFGRCAAKLDDVVNYLPSRISAYLMINACSFLGKEYDRKRAAEIYRRDRYNHASPNSAQTEAACAGALGIKLAGDASYFGKTVKKQYIGDDIRKINTQDIKRANRLLYASAIQCELFCVIILIAVSLC